MGFAADKQTVADLGIFGRPGMDSVFSIFNRTRTVGGADFLRGLFTYPLNDAVAINERVNTFKHFADLDIQFPFPVELFSIVENYLGNEDQRTRLVHNPANLSKKLIDLVAPDAVHKLLVKGIISLHELLIELWKFLQAFPVAGGGSFKREKDAVFEILREVPFDQLAQQKKGHVPDQAELIELDALFRFKRRAAMKKVLAFIYQLDAHLSVGKVARERKLCFPEALPRAKSLQIVQVYHLLLKNPVPNSIEINTDKNMVFLTGANMAGKSTLMKAIGIAIFLAHAGFPVPAEKMEFPVMDGLFTTINLSDNLNQAASHFYAEVLRVKKVAAELGLSKNLFVIFDELFRGTNVKDAYEATVAITAAFAARRGSMFMISTHIIEAGEDLKQKCSNIQFRYLPTKMEGQIPVYPYMLEEGITDDRHGMIIIQNEGILDILNGKKISK